MRLTRSLARVSQKRSQWQVGCEQHPEHLVVMFLLLCGGGRKRLCGRVGLSRALLVTCTHKSKNARYTMTQSGTGTCPDV